MVKLIVITLVILILWKFTPYIESIPSIIKLLNLIDNKLLFICFSIMMPGVILTIIGLYLTRR